MKRIVLITIIATAFIVFASCNKEKENENANLSKLSFNNLDEVEKINKISSEMADFHTFVMKKFLVEMYRGNEVLDEKVLQELVVFIEKEMRSYNFNHIKLCSNNIHFSEILNLKNIETMISLSETGYDLSKLQLDLPGESSPMLQDYIATLNTALIQEKCNRIEDIIPNIINGTESFEMFKERFLYHAKRELADVQTTNEYMYLRFFADMYLSSFEYVTEYLFNDNSKGKFWDTVKEAWKIAKPVVGADAGGAVTGAMIGAVGTGPGVVAGGMVGACATSAGYCITRIIGG